MLSGPRFRGGRVARPLSDPATFAAVRRSDARSPRRVSLGRAMRLGPRPRPSSFSRVGGWTSASLNLSVAERLLQRRPVRYRTGPRSRFRSGVDTRAHPFERSILAALLGRSPRRVAAPPRLPGKTARATPPIVESTEASRTMSPKPELHDPPCGGVTCVGEKTRVKDHRTGRWFPSSSTFSAPASPVRDGKGHGESPSSVADRPETPFECHPAKSDTVRKVEAPFTVSETSRVEGWLPRARLDQRPFTPPVLQSGHCSGTQRLCDRSLNAWP